MPRMGLRTMEDPQSETAADKDLKGDQPVVLLGGIDTAF